MAWMRRTDQEETIKTILFGVTRVRLSVSFVIAKGNNPFVLQLGDAGGLLHNCLVLLCQPRGRRVNLRRLIGCEALHPPVAVIIARGVRRMPVQRAIGLQDEQADSGL